MTDKQKTDALWAALFITIGSLLIINIVNGFVLPWVR